MRNEFYGDRKDLWKWAVVLDEARDRQVLYVAMYRPDRKPKLESGIRKDVVDFFYAERKDLNAEKECSRIKHLSSRIVPFLERYEPKRMDAYLAPVKQALESRAKPSSYAIFLDPDTGISEKSGPEHVCPHLLASVWKSMLPGDTLLIYQHFAHRKVDLWLPEKTTLIAAGTAGSDVTYKLHSGVCFFVINKKEPAVIDAGFFRVQTERS